MPMLHTIVLICALGTDRSACDPQTALFSASIQAPDNAPAMCPIAPDERVVAVIAKLAQPGTYPKVLCQRETETAQR